MNLQKDILLKDYSTFKIGGSAKYFCECENLNDIKDALKWARDKEKDFFILGGGSNILFNDNGFNGLIVRMLNQELRMEDDKIICGSGVNLTKLINFSIENNLVGLEWAVGIPGTVGGAVRGNAGAFGGQMVDSIKNIKVLKMDSISKSFEVIDFKKEDCQFGYRDSIFKKDKNLIIWETEFEFQLGKKEKSEKMIREILMKRKEKQPLKYPSAGSIFKNPIVSEEIIKQFEENKKIKCKDRKVPAGWLIERSGLKGKKIGGAKISEKQANFIVNVGNATSDDVVILISLIKQKVRNKFGIQLQEEIEIVV